MTTNSRFHGIFIAVLVLLGILLTIRNYDNSFHFDDFLAIVENPAIKDVSNIDAIWEYDRARFVGTFSFALNYHFHQLALPAWHATNIAIHIFNAIALYFFIILLFRTKRLKTAKPEKVRLLASFAALVFLLHPLQTMAVTYIVQRYASLVTFFYLLTIIFYLLARQSGIRRHQILFGIACVFSTLLAFNTKENSATIPLSLAAIEWVFIRANSLRIRLNKKFFLGLSAFILFAFIAFNSLVFTVFQKFNEQFPMHKAYKAAVTATIADILVEKPPLQGNLEGISAKKYALTQSRVHLRYLVLLFFPVNQSVDHAIQLSKSLFEWRTLLAFLVLGSIFVFAFYIFPKFPLISFSILWYFLLHSVESSIIPITNPMFEHRMVLPMVAASLGFAEFFSSFRMKRKLLLAGLYFSLLFALSFQRAEVWQTELSLWEDALEKYPNRARSLNSIGTAHFKAGNYKKAKEAFNKAVEANPNFEKSYENRVSVWLLEGNLEAAATDLQKSMELFPNHPKTLYGYGQLMVKMDSLEAARSSFMQLLKERPGNLVGRLEIGKLDVMENKYLAAEQNLSELLLFLPKNPEPAKWLTKLYLKSNQKVAAMELCNIWIRIEENAENLGIRAGLHYENNNFIDAAMDFEKALKIDPSQASLRYNTILCYLQKAELAKAQNHARIFQKNGRTLPKEILKDLQF